MGFQMILASHGSLAEGMVTAVKMIAGTYANVSAFGLDTYQTPQQINDEVKKKMAEYPKDLFVIVCDIKCGSVHNQLVQHCEQERVMLVSGMNLALVLELLLCPQEMMSAEFVKGAVERAKENIMYFDKATILEANEKEDELW